MELVYRFPFKCNITLLVGFGRGSDQWEGTILVEQVDCPSFVSNLVPTSSPLFVGLLLQIPVYPSSPFAALHSLYLCIWVSNCWNLWQGFGWKREFLPSVICVFLPGEPLCGIEEKDRIVKMCHKRITVIGIIDIYFRAFRQIYFALFVLETNVDTSSLTKYWLQEYCFS